MIGRAARVLLVLLSCWGTGCDDDGGSGGGDPCAAYIDTCVRVGETKCATTAAVQVCEVNSEGCRVWTRSQLCSERQDCQSMAGGHSCVCDNDCRGEGPVACNGDAIVSCVPAEDGCLILQETRDCDAEGLVCNESSGTPECAVFCVDRCETVGTTECSGNNVVSCFVGPHGCLALRVELDCSVADQVCDPGGGSPTCVDP